MSIILSKEYLLFNYITRRISTCRWFHFSWNYWIPFSCCKFTFRVTFEMKRRQIGNWPGYLDRVVCQRSTRSGSNLLTPILRLFAESCLKSASWLPSLPADRTFSLVSNRYISIADRGDVRRKLARRSADCSRIWHHQRVLIDVFRHFDFLYS